MIDWVLAHHRNIVRFSRWIVVGCAVALLGISQLPPNPLDRLVALLGIAIIVPAFLIWLGVALITILRPRLFEDLRRRRSR